MPKTVHLHVTRIPIEDVPSSDEDVKAWLMARWQAKDKLLDDFYRWANSTATSTILCPALALLLRCSSCFSLLFVAPLLSCRCAVLLAVSCAPMCPVCCAWAWLWLCPAVLLLSIAVC